MGLSAPAVEAVSLALARAQKTRLAPFGLRDVFRMLERADVLANQPTVHEVAVMDDERLCELITLSDFGQLAGLSREAVLNTMDDDLAPEVDNLCSLPVLVLRCCRTQQRVPRCASGPGCRTFRTRPRAGIAVAVRLTGSGRIAPVIARTGRNTARTGADRCRDASPDPVTPAPGRPVSRGRQGEGGGGAAGRSRGVSSGSAGSGGIRQARGVCKPDSEWSPMGARAHHTITGRNRRCRKGLEPSRRLSETTGPQSPSAFRIAFRRQR